MIHSTLALLVSIYNLEIDYTLIILKGLSLTKS